MTHTTSSIRRNMRSNQHPLPRTSTQYPLFASMILCPSHQVRPFAFAQMSPRFLLHLGAAPTLPETILREDFQSSSHQKQEFVVDREGEMPTFVKPSLPNPNELRQAMSSTPVSVSSAPIDDDIPRSRSLDPIKVTRSRKKGTTGKKKRTSKPEVAAS